MSIWKGYCKVVEKINLVSIYLAAISLIAMTVIIVTEIFCRSFLGFSTLIADEFGGYLLCAATFFTGSYCLSQDGFLKVDIVYGRLKPGKLPKFICDLIIWVTALVYCGFLFYFCLYVVQSSLAFDATSAYISKTPLAYPQSIMLVGIVCLILQLIVNLGQTLIYKGNPPALPGDSQGNYTETVAEEAKEALLPGQEVSQA